ncbi:MAG TPA: plasmid mobilization relaxosome protein MobC [Candidatus Mediterraneibacter intestinigallinarum]|nr:plasmid mobilization relaxosome protein MobC [Candidatus Mediterraneibacter intestinigallinarum]
MRKRNIAILFRLNRKEAEALDKRVKKSGLSREAYLRQLINGLVPRNAPPPDYYSMMRELHRIGNNLNQIVQKAHVLNVIDVQRYDQEVRKFRQAVEQITAAVVLPERADQRTADQRECQKWQ